MKVKLLQGRLAGEVQDLPYHAATALTASGQALVVDAEVLTGVVTTAAIADEAGVVAVEADASGEVIVAPIEVAATPVDPILTHATSGRAAEPRVVEPAPARRLRR